jgi:hypothetical protein
MKTLKQVVQALPGTRALFIDPMDGEPLIQDVLVWALYDITASGGLEHYQEVVGLTAMPHSLRLADCDPYSSNFVGYLTTRDDNDSIIRKIESFQLYKKEMEDSGK